MRFGPLDLCWVSTVGGKALVAETAEEAAYAVQEAKGLEREWLTFPMPNGGTAHFRVADITCINSHVVPKADNNHPGGIAA